MAKRKKLLQHESAEFAARRIMFFGAGLLLFVVVLSAVSFVIIGRRSAQRSAFVAGDSGVPAPRLQAQPLDDYSRYIAEKRAQLESAGWVDREHHLAHIPIEQAMDQVARESEAKRQ